MSNDTCKIIFDDNDDSSDYKIIFNDKSNISNKSNKVFDNLIIIDDNIETINLDELKESDYIGLSINIFIKFKEIFQKYNIYLSLSNDNNNNNLKFLLKGENLYNLVNLCNNDINIVSNILRLSQIDKSGLYNICRMDANFVKLCLKSDYEISDIIDYCNILHTLCSGNVEFSKIHDHYSLDMITHAYEFSKYLCDNNLTDTDINYLIDWVSYTMYTYYKNEDEFKNYVKDVLSKYNINNNFDIINIQRIISEYEDFDEFANFINELVIKYL